MMYSQQEYDMVRRQTMQIEAEKRAVLRFTLIVVTVLFTLSLLLTGWMYQRYSSFDNEAKAANAKVAAIDNQLRQVSSELAEKKATLVKYEAIAAKQNAVIDSVVPKMLTKTASETEMAVLAQAIYQQPGHTISLTGMPPDKVLKRYRIRTDGQLQTYMLIRGLVDSKWILYSNLLMNQGD